MASGIFVWTLFTSAVALVCSASWCRASEPAYFRELGPVDLRLRTAVEANRFITTFTLPAGQPSFYLRLKIDRPDPAREVRFDVAEQGGPPVWAAHARGKWIDLGAKQGSGSFLSPRLSARQKALRFIVERRAGDDKPFVRIEGALVSNGPQGIRQADTQHYDAPTESDNPNGVAFLVFSPRDRPPYPCTGFAIGDGSLLMTAAHCSAFLLPNDASASGNVTCDDVNIEFGHLADRSGQNVKCLRLAWANTALDYAVFEIPKSPRPAPYLTGPVEFNSAANMARVLSHPNGEPLRRSQCTAPSAIGPVPLTAQRAQELRRSCEAFACGADGPRVEERLSALTSVQPAHLSDWLHHTCQAEGGSSGAPILQNSKVVGIHKGVDLRLVGNPGSDLCAKCFNETLHLDNWGIQICKVLADLFLARRELFDKAGLAKCVM